MRIRFYEPDDDLPLRLIDQKCPQGQGISIYHRCHHFVAHAEMYRNHFTCVAEHQGKIVGATSGALKNLRIGASIRKAGYIFDVRVDPEIRRHGIGHSLVVQVSSALEQAGAELLYAIVMDSNRPAKRLFADGLGFRQQGAFITYTIPVFRSRDVHASVRILQSPEEIDQLVSPHFADHNFFPPGDERYPDQGQYLFMHATCSDSYAGLLRSTREQIFDLMVHSLTPSLRLVRPVLDGVRSVYPMPRIPSVGKAMPVWWLGEPIVSGPRGTDLLTDAMSYVSNLALEAHIPMLLIQVDVSDPIRKQVQRAAFEDMISKTVGRLGTVKSILLTKELRRCLPRHMTAAYADTRDF